MHKNNDLFLIPAAKRDEVNAALESLGYGPNNVSVPLKKGSRVTHYALQIRTTDAIRERILAVIPLGTKQKDLRQRKLDEVLQEEGLVRKFED